MPPTTLRPKDPNSWSARATFEGAGGGGSITFYLNDGVTSAEAQPLIDLLNRLIDDADNPLARQERDNNAFPVAFN